MKNKNHVIKWLAILLVVMGATMGAKAQVGTLTKTGAQFVCLGSTEEYGVVETSGSTYTWTITPATGGTPIGTSNVISVNWILPGDYTVQVVEKNASNCEGLPINILVTVYPELKPGVATADQTICFNAVPAPIVATLPTGGDGIYTYQWESSIDAGANWIPISGATNLTYAPAALSQTTDYRLVQTSKDCGSVITNPVVITIQPNLLAGIASAEQAICYGETPNPIVSTAPTGGDGTYTYQWESSIDAGANWAAISGATSLTYAPGALTQTTHYRLIQTSGSCGTVTTNAIVITVHPLPVITLNGPSPICEASTSNVYTTDAGMTSYVWVVSAGGTITAGGTATDNTVTVTWNIAGPQSVSVNYKDANGCSAVTPFVYGVTVTPLPATSPIYHR